MNADLFLEQPNKSVLTRLSRSCWEHILRQGFPVALFVLCGKCQKWNFCWLLCYNELAVKKWFEFLEALGGENLHTIGYTNNVTFADK